MKRIFMLLLLTGPSLMAQKLAVSGVVKDSTGTALSPATVLILNPMDSSLINFTSTDKDGHFSLKNLPAYDLQLKITYLGFEPVVRDIKAYGTQTEFDFGLIEMSPQVQQLDEVVIESAHAPVTVKKDTIEFNATSFKTAANAVVEDLLKKLPGVEVDADGTIRAQGEEVDRVTVDGKHFFGNDPKIATRNLPADAVDKVQVFDKKSDQATFSGIDDGQREKTINLALKEEKRNAVFGNLISGLGTDERFQAKANINRFRKTEQFSVLGMTNNVNEQGFGIEEYMNFTGGSRQMMSGGRVRVEINGSNQNGIPLSFGGRTSGILRSGAGGINFNKEFSKKTELTTSYFYNELDHDLDQDLERINFFDKGNVKFSQRSQQSNRNRNHQLNAALDQKLDSMNSLKVITSLKYNETDSHLQSEGENLAPDGAVLNESVTKTASSGTTATVNANALWRHRFAKKGRTMSTNVQFSTAKVERAGDQEAVTEFYAPDARTEIQNQINDQSNNTQTWGTSLSYTEPLGQRRYIEGSYSFLQTNNTVEKNVYDIGSGEEVFNETLSNKFQSRYQYHRGGLSFKMNSTNYNLTMGASLQRTFLTGELTSLNSSIDRSFQNLLPVARLDIDFNETRHLEVHYQTSVQEPSIQELQPVVDNSDPLNLYKGNPSLRPAYEHSLRMEFANFDQVRLINFFAFVEGTMTQHAITTSQHITEEQIRISQPVNVSGKQQLNSDVTFGFPINKIKSRFSISGNASLINSVNILNETEQSIRQQQFGSRVRYDFRYKEVFDFGLSANITKNVTHYEFSSKADQRYMNQTYRAEGILSFLRNYQLTSSMEYLVYQNAAANFTQQIPLLNISISRFVLKNKSGEIKIAVTNLLDSKIGVSQSSNINYTERTTADSLGRYFLLSFSYALNKFMNPLAGRPGGRQIRIMR